MDADCHGDGSCDPSRRVLARCWVCTPMDRYHVLERSRWAISASQVGGTGCPNIRCLHPKRFLG